MPRLSFSRPGLTGLIDSDSDDAQFEEQSTMMSPARGNENAIPAKKVRGRPKAAVSKVTKAPKSPAKKGRRPALKDRTNAQSAGTDLDVDDMGGQDDTTITINETMASMNDLDASAMTIQEVVKPRATKTKAPVKTSKAAKAASAKIDEIDYISDAPKPEPKVAAAKKANQRKRQREEEPEGFKKEIQETQVPYLDLEDEDVDVPTPMPIVPQNKLSRSAATTLQPSLGRSKVESAPEPERHNPTQHRNVGDLTKQLESLEAKYRNLREVGIKEADRLFEKYKRQAEESKKISNGLIATLKAEVAAQTSQIKETRALKKRVEAQEDEMSDLQAKLSRANTNLKAEVAAQSTQVKETRTLKRKLEAQDDEISELQRKLARVNDTRAQEHDDEVSRLKAKLAETNQSLSEAQTENKTLSTRLAATRTAAASVESINTRAPSSAKKGAAAVRMMGTAEAAAAAQAAQLKEDLYSDLTGLIIRNVKREEEEDIFDCIQTGRNGTLHFKFGVPNEKNADYDDARCQYIPLLDPSRDQELNEVLPDYLTEEMTFPRTQVDKFYTRVFKAITERPL